MAGDSHERRTRSRDFDAPSVGERLRTAAAPRSGPVEAPLGGVHAEIPPLTARVVPATLSGPPVLRVTHLPDMDVTCLAAGTVAAEVRQRMGFRLAAWGLMHIAHDAFLIADELITNACAATPHGEIRIRFTREVESVLVGVWDSSDQMPMVKAVVELTLDDLDLSEDNFDDNGGWGLPLVRALSCDCGVSRTSPRGKWVWSRLTTVTGK
jgi:hypothetical protein